LVALIAVPSSAFASVDVLCVQPATGCDVAATYATLDGALNAAASSSDASARIELGTAAYNETNDVYTGDVPLTIAGAGEGKTVLNGLITTSSPNAVLIVNGGVAAAAVTIQDLSVQIPASGSGAAGIFNLGASPLTVSDVAVSDAGAAGANVGLALETGDTVSHATVDMTSNADVGEEGAHLVEDSSITGPTGILALGVGNVQLVQRSTITGTAKAALNAPSGTIGVSECLLLETNGAADVDDASTQNGLTIEQSTLSGDGSGAGLIVESTGATSSRVIAFLNDSIIDPKLVNSIVLNKNGPGTGYAIVDNTYDDFAGATSTAAGQPTNGVAGSYESGFEPGAHDTGADPKFASPGHDLRLLPGSPAMDQVTTGIPAGDSTTDRLGNPVSVDGAPRDIGAYQHQAPTLTASATPKMARVGAPVTFSATAASINPGDSFSYSWKFDDGASATGAAVTHAFAKAGAHTATVTVTGAGPAGFSTIATAGVTVAAPPPAPTVFGGLLSGLAGGKPKLKFTVAAGTGAPELKSISVGLPSGLSFSKKPSKGIKVKGANGKALKLSVKLSHGNLTITLKAPASPVSVSISGGSLSVTKALSSKVKHKRVGHLTVSLKVTDAARATTKLALKLKPT
jgi:PKD repeat protein